MSKKYQLPHAFPKGGSMLRDDAINEGLIKPTKEDLLRRGEPLPKPGPKPKAKTEEKETDVERMTKPK